MRIEPPDLIKVTEIFLIPNSFIVAALGTADTNVHRAAVSVLGLIVSTLWWAGSHEALTERGAEEEQTAIRHPLRTRMLYWLPVVFTLGWLASTAVHVLTWNKPLGVIGD